MILHTILKEIQYLSNNFKINWQDHTHTDLWSG